MSKYTDAMKAAWKAGRSYLTEKGEEIPDPTPLEMPIGFSKPPDLQSEIRALTGAAVQRELHEKGLETFDEADDFDIPDEDMSSPWEAGHLGSIWTREAEIRAGTVEPPDFQSARELSRRALVVLSRYDKNGNLKPVVEKSKDA